MARFRKMEQDSYNLKALVITEDSLRQDFVFNNIRVNREYVPAKIKYNAQISTSEDNLNLFFIRDRRVLRDIFGIEISLDVLAKNPYILNIFGLYARGVIDFKKAENLLSFIKDADESAIKEIISLEDSLERNEVFPLVAISVMNILNSLNTKEGQALFKKLLKSVGFNGIAEYDIAKSVYMTTVAAYLQYNSNTRHFINNRKWLKFLSEGSTIIFSLHKFNDFNEITEEEKRDVLKFYNVEDIVLKEKDFEFFLSDEFKPLSFVGNEDGLRFNAFNYLDKKELKLILNKKLHNSVRDALSESHRKTQIASALAYYDILVESKDMGNKMSLYNIKMEALNDTQSPPSKSVILNILKEQGVEIIGIENLSDRKVKSALKKGFKLVVKIAINEFMKPIAYLFQKSKYFTSIGTDKDLFGFILLNKLSASLLSIEEKKALYDEVVSEVKTILEYNYDNNKSNKYIKEVMGSALKAIDGHLKEILTSLNDF